MFPSPPLLSCIRANENSSAASWKARHHPPTTIWAREWSASPHSSVPHGLSQLVTVSADALCCLRLAPFALCTFASSWLVISGREEMTSAHTALQGQSLSSSGRTWRVLGTSDIRWCVGGNAGSVFGLWGKAAPALNTCPSFRGCLLCLFLRDSFCLPTHTESGTPWRSMCSCIFLSAHPCPHSPS